jgi:hypothetical protein
MPLRAPFGVLIGGMDLFVRNYTQGESLPSKKKKHLEIK